VYLSILDHWILLNYFWAADNFLWTRISQYPEEGRSIPHQLYQCGQAARRHLNCLWAYPSSWGNHPAHPQAPPRFGGPHRHHVNHQAVRWHHTERSLCSSETCGRIFTLWQEAGLWRHWVHWLWQWKLPRIRLHGSTDYIKVRLRRPSATLSSLHQRPRGDEHRSEIRRDFANCKWVRIEQRWSRFLDERARAATTPFHLAKNPSMSSPTSSCCPRNGAGIPSSEFWYWPSSSCLVMHVTRLAYMPNTHSAT